MSAPERKPTKTVKAIAEISFTGDVIPPEWLRHVRTDSKSHRADPIGVLILARIVYWYRPKRVMDEDTQAVLRYERKFAGDKLQVNRRAWAEALGINLCQFDRSLNNLVRLGLVTKELRQLEVRGQSLNNVMFLEPVPEAVAAISQMPELTEADELTEDEGDTPPLP